MEVEREETHREEKRQKDGGQEGAWWEAELDYEVHARCAFRWTGFVLISSQFHFLET